MDFQTFQAFDHIPDMPMKLGGAELINTGPYEATYKNVKMTTESVSVEDVWSWMK